MTKSTTSRITIFEPDEDKVKHALAGRNVTPELIDFLKHLLKEKKWTRKIIIPSDRDNVAALHVFTTGLKEVGLEIFSELHIFLVGKIMVEKWQVVGERERISFLPKEAFRAISIDKVQVEGARVNVQFNMPTVGGQSRTVVKTFDFSLEEPKVRIVPHPLFEGA